MSSERYQRGRSIFPDAHRALIKTSAAAPLGPGTSRNLELGWAHSGGPRSSDNKNIASVATCFLYETATCRSHTPAFSLVSTSDSIKIEALQAIVTGYEVRGPIAADCQWPLLFVSSMISQPRRPPPYSPWLHPAARSLV